MYVTTYLFYIHPEKYSHWAILICLYFRTLELNGLHCAEHIIYESKRKTIVLWVSGALLILFLMVLLRIPLYG